MSIEIPPDEYEDEGAARGRQLHSLTHQIQQQSLGAQLGRGSRNSGQELLPRDSQMTATFAGNTRTKNRVHSSRQGAFNPIVSPQADSSAKKRGHQRFDMNPVDEYEAHAYTGSHEKEQLVSTGGSKPGEASGSALYYNYNATQVDEDGMITQPDLTLAGTHDPINQHL